MPRLTIVVAALAIAFFALNITIVEARTLRLVALGDSLTAGLGLSPSDTLPAQLERALRARGHDVAIANAGVSGDTAAAGRDRLDWSVPEGTDAVIVALGANDALRGLPVARMERALDEIVSRLKSRGVAVLLAGMAAPRSLGEDYVRAYDAVFPRLAEKHGVVFYPFLLDGVAFDRALNLPDGIHPNARGVAVIAERLVPPVERLFTQVSGR